MFLLQVALDKMLVISVNRNWPIKTILMCVHASTPPVNKVWTCPWLVVKIKYKILSNISVFLFTWLAASVVRDATGNHTDFVTAGVPCTGPALAACELGYNFSSCAVEKCSFGLTNNNQVHSVSFSSPQRSRALHYFFLSLMLSSPHLWFRWWPWYLGMAPSSLLEHSQPPFHQPWPLLSVRPKSSRSVTHFLEIQCTEIQLDYCF